MTAGTIGAETDSGSGTADNGTANGTCTLTATGQTALAGQPTQFLATLSGGSVSSIVISRNGLIIGDANSYSSSTGLYTNSVQGCGGLSHATVTFKYLVLEERLVSGTGQFPEPSSGSALPACYTSPQTTSSSDGWTGTMKLSCGLSLGTVSFGTDNTAAFKAAIGVINAQSAAATPQCIYIPTGNYLTFPLNTPAVGYGCFIGDEHYHSNVMLIPNSAGDLFSWMNSNKNGAQQLYGNTQTFSNLGAGTAALPNTANQAGASFRNITVIGNRESAGIQNALMFYGPTQFALVDNCVVSYVRGHALGAGFPNTSSPALGSFTESRVQNCHFDNDGDGGAMSGSPTAAFELTASNNGTTGVDAPNTITLSDLRVFDSWGPGMWIHQGAGASDSDSAIQLNNILIEGSGLSQQGGLAAGDLLQFGTSTLPSSDTTNVVNITCRNVYLVNPILFYAALHVSASQANAANTGNIDCEGGITAVTGSLGRGVQLDGCQNCSFKMVPNSASDYSLVLGTSFTASGCAGAHQLPPSSTNPNSIVYDAAGAEGALTTCIDPAAASALEFPQRQFVTANNSVPSSIVSAITNTAGTVFFVTTNTAATAGSGISINSQSPLWSVLRSGPTAAFSDSWDTAANILATLASGPGGGTAPGINQVYHSRVCNQTADVETISVASGETGSAATIAGSTCKIFTFLVTSLAPAITISGQ